MMFLKTLRGGDEVFYENNSETSDVGSCRSWHHPRSRDDRGLVSTFVMPETLEVANEVGEILVGEPGFEAFGHEGKATVA